MKNRGSPWPPAERRCLVPLEGGTQIHHIGPPPLLLQAAVQFFQHPSPLDAPPLFPAGRQVGMHIGIGQHAAGVVPVNAVMRGMEIAANIHIQHSHIHPSGGQRLRLLFIKGAQQRRFSRRVPGGNHQHFHFSSPYPSSLGEVRLIILHLPRTWQVKRPAGPG